MVQKLLFFVLSGRFQSARKFCAVWSNKWKRIEKGKFEKTRKYLEINISQILRNNYKKDYCYSD